MWMVLLRISGKDMLRRKTCRKFYKELRDNMSQEQVFLRSKEICKYILESAEYNAAEIILAYYPLGNEVDCIPVIKAALNVGKQVALPRIGAEFQMDFLEIHDLNNVEEGSFHVMEPKVECKRFIPKHSQIESENQQGKDSVLVLVPGVVFDTSGNRYGYGKGYYDRYFARYPHLKRMGIAYTQQMADVPLESQKTDVKMHVIITDTGRIDVK